MEQSCFDRFFMFKKWHVNDSGKTNKNSLERTVTVNTVSMKGIEKPKVAMMWKVEDCETV